MPREGVFTEVIIGGEIEVGDEVVMLPPEKDRPFTAAIITVSDKGSAGERVDESGPIIKEMLEKAGYDVKEMLIVPDEKNVIATQLMRLSDQRQINLILTTGGTGFSIP